MGGGGALQQKRVSSSALVISMGLLVAPQGRMGSKGIEQWQDAGHLVVGFLIFGVGIGVGDDAAPAQQCS